MHGCMHGWMRVDGLMDGCMCVYGLMDGWIDCCFHPCPLVQSSLRRKRAAAVVTQLRRNVRATTIQSVWRMVPLRRRFVKQRKHAVVVQVRWQGTMLCCDAVCLSMDRANSPNPSHSLSSCRTNPILRTHPHSRTHTVSRMLFASHEICHLCACSTVPMYPL